MEHWTIELLLMIDGTNIDAVYLDFLKALAIRCPMHKHFLALWIGEHVR